MREGGGNCRKYLKRGGTEKRRGDTKMLKRGDNLGWVCQRPSHTLFMVCYVLPLSHQHQPTMIKTIGSREAMRGKNLTHHRRNN